MQVLENPANERMIAKTLGKPYSLMQKVKLKGTGSAKFIYLKGIEAFEPIKALNGDLDYVNFELYPKGLVFHYSKGNTKRGLAIKADEITQIGFDTRKVKLVLKGGRIKIVDEAVLDFHLKDGTKLTFYASTNSYQALHDYMGKDWLGDKTTFTLNSAPPRESKVFDEFGVFTDFLELLLS